MISVVHVISGLETGGAELMLERLVLAHDRSRVEPRVVSLTTVGPVGERLGAAGVRVDAVGARRVPGPRSFVALRRSLRGADVVQTWLYDADVFGGVTARLHRTPVVWGLRQTALDRTLFDRRIRAVAALAARLSRRIPARIVCCSQTVADDHAAIGFDRSRMVVIPNGYDFGVWKPDATARTDVRCELGLPADAVLVGMVARFHPQKDHRTFISAMGELARRDSRVHGLLVGRGVDDANEALRGWTAATGVPSAFSLVGERRDVPRLTAALDCAVLSSFLEGFPNVVVEALACGVPCVASAVAEAPALVGDPDVTFSPGDADGLTRAVRGVLARGQNEKSARSRADRERMIERYSLPAVTARYESLYADVAGGA